jgi:hypothetical protein
MVARYEVRVPDVLLAFPYHSLQRSEEQASMRNRGNEGFHHPARRCPAALDEKKLGRDVLSAISRLFADGEEFPGHDGRQYAIIGINAEEIESEGFIDVVVKLDDASNGGEIRDHSAANLSLKLSSGGMVRQTAN